MLESDNAWRAVLFPELLGPMKTTGLPNSISTRSNFLKLHIVSLVSTDPPLAYSAENIRETAVYPIKHTLAPFCQAQRHGFASAIAWRTLPLAFFRAEAASARVTPAASITTATGVRLPEAFRARMADA